MKLMMILVCLGCLPAMATTLNLNSGDSVTIQPNAPTTVTCNGTGGAVDCNNDSASGFQMVQSCGDHGYNALDCIRTTLSNAPGLKNCLKFQASCSDYCSSKGYNVLDCQNACAGR